MRTEEASVTMAGLPDFNEWGAFMDDGVVPGPWPSTLATESEQDSSAEELNPGPSEDLDDDEDSGEEARSGNSFD
jgi:hypothetical protein